jgi:radical SAM protein with 4Fe4S-binding SPASM domain
MEEIQSFLYLILRNNVLELSTKDSRFLFNEETFELSSSGYTFREPLEVSHNDTFMNKDGIETLRILMGDRCNFSCSFCSHSISKGKIDAEAQREYVDKFFIALDTLELPELKKISLWGGEPLLYLDTMKYLIQGFNARFRDLEVSTVTNGSLLNESAVEYFGSIPNKVLITISHDGMKTTYRDPISEKTIISALHSISKYNNIGISFNVVIGANNSDIIGNYDFFQNLAKQSGLTSVHVSTEMFKDYKGEYTSDIEYRDNINKAFFKFYNGTMPYLSMYNDIREKFKLNGAVTISKFNCYIEYNDIIDINLNDLSIRNCMTFESTKTVPLQEYKTFIADDSIVEYTDKCTVCPVKFLCRGSCPYMDKDKLITHNCDFIKDYYTIMIKQFFSSITTSEIIKVELCKTIEK